jgi:hypothetical protein
MGGRQPFRSPGRQPAGAWQGCGRAFELRPMHHAWPSLPGPGGRQHRHQPAPGWQAARRQRPRAPDRSADEPTKAWWVQAEYRARPAHRQRPPHRQPDRPDPLARHQPPARPGRPGRRAHLYPPGPGTNACSSSPPKPMPASTSAQQCFGPLHAALGAATGQGQLDPAQARRPAIGFDVDVNRLDADSYLAGKSTPALGPAADKAERPLRSVGAATGWIWMARSASAT